VRASQERVQKPSHWPLEDCRDHCKLISGTGCATRSWHPIGFKGFLAAIKRTSGAESARANAVHRWTRLAKCEMGERKVPIVPPVGQKEYCRHAAECLGIAEMLLIAMAKAWLRLAQQDEIELPVRSERNS
jgi:hypothetical protein